MNEQSNASVGTSPYVSVRWQGDTLGQLELLDQTLLPESLQMVPIQSVEQAHEAIVSLQVRGAPAIGIAAAYAVLVGMQSLVRRRAPSMSPFSTLEPCAITSRRVAPQP